MKQKMKRSRGLSYFFFGMLILIMIGLIVPSQVLAAGKAPDKIRFGNPIALSGIYAFGAKTTQIAPFDMWAKEVLNKGKHRCDA